MYVIKLGVITSVHCSTGINSASRTRCYYLYFLQHWSKLSKSGGGPWPEERGSHAACCLNYGQEQPQLFVTGGEDKISNLLGDVWTLDVNNGKWKRVRPLYIILCIPL